jgi:hypothetical protein
MKRILAIALVLASTLVVAGASSAQEHRVKATVPFNFTVGDFTVPAGTYTVDSTAISPDVLVLRNVDKDIKIVTTGRSNQSNPQRVSALVFHKYGNQYFLSQIRSEGASINVDFPVTKAEKRAWTRVTWTQAKLAEPIVSDPVLIALNQ